MKRVYVANDPVDAHMLRDLLEAEGIPSTYGAGSGSFGHRDPRYPGEPPSVWILDESDLLRATKFVEEYSRRGSRRTGPAATWRCNACGESVEEQFDACWKCSSSRGDPDDATFDPRPCDVFR